jgi:hypothetical protein
MLKYGLGIVLMFVGLKMTLLNRLFGGHFPIAWSLGIIIGVIAASIVLSLLIPPKKTPEDAPQPLRTSPSSRRRSRPAARTSRSGTWTWS